MTRSRHYTGSLSVVGLIVLLILTWGLDYLRAYLSLRMPQLAPLFPRYFLILWLLAASYLVLAALLLLLFWFLLSGAPRNAGIAALYLLVGSFLAFFRVLYFVPVIGSWMPPFLYGPLLSTTSYTILAGSFISITGLFMLILPRTGPIVRQ